MSLCPASMLDPGIALPALGDSFRKLDPRHMARNPATMFVTEVGAALATFLFVKELGDASTKQNVFAALVLLRGLVFDGRFVLR